MLLKCLIEASRVKRVGVFGVKAEFSAIAGVDRLFTKSSGLFQLSLPTGTAIMRVVEIVIDGFKSYAVRTVISGWDESFNSITGLNGSGKSNILDAICFVLGITSMSTVRAQNIQVSLGWAFSCDQSLLRLKSGPNLQTGPSGRDQSQRHHRLRQPR